MIATQPETIPVKKIKVKAPSYFPAIDGLRAIAVILVLFHHYFHQGIALGTQLGGTGVDFFFVISGFLITGIVLSYRSKPIGQALKTFYIRRTLRIFPLYYLYLILVAVLFWNIATGKELLYAFLYAQNFYVITGNAVHLPIGHFWSLAVEEQFYIAWPLLMLIIPYRFIKGFILFSVFFSLVFAICCTIIPIPYGAYMHPVSCMQALSLGAFLSIAFRKQKHKSDFLKTVSAKSNILLLVFFCCWLVTLKFQWYHHALYPFLRTFNALMAFVILVKIIKPRKSPKNVDRLFTSVLNSAVLQFIGRISYGIYVYHNLVKELLDPYVKELTNNSPHSYILTFPAYSAITIGIAYLSFRFIESPINKLKDRFTING